MSQIVGLGHTTVLDEQNDGDTFFSVAESSRRLDGRDRADADVRGI